MDKDEDATPGECQVRDYYAASLASVRPREVVVRREQRYNGSRLRADLRTVDEVDVLREWEFKLRADYRALGQILQYVALARRAENFRAIRGVIAAFEFSEELVLANEILNLNLELVHIPQWMRLAGGVRVATAPAKGIRIPFTKLHHRK